MVRPTLVDKVPLHRNDEREMTTEPRLHFGGAEHLHSRGPLSGVGVKYKERRSPNHGLLLRLRILEAAQRSLRRGLGSTHFPARTEEHDRWSTEEQENTEEHHER